MDYVIDSCKRQAQWHYEQYEKFSGYIEYYNGLNEQNKSINKNINRDINLNNASNVSATNINRRKKRSRKKKTKTKRQAAHTSQEECNSENEEEVFQLDDGFREFLKQSAEFRKQRDAEKLRKEKEEELADDNNEDDDMECVEYVDLTLLSQDICVVSECDELLDIMLVLRKGPEGTILPPTASNRKQLYEDKYGELGTTILSLETALQWKYNAFTDATSPAPWPSLQLRFQ